MIHLHHRNAAIAFTGGVDSTVLAYWLCDQLDSLEDFVHPTPQPPGHVPTLQLIACNYGQTAWTLTESFLHYHTQTLTERYFGKVKIVPIALEVKLPAWTTMGGLFLKGFVPPKQDEIVDYKAETRRYDYCYVDGLNSILYSWMLAWCSKEKINYLLTGHQLEVNEFDNFDGYQYRTDDSTGFFLDRMNLMNECGFQNRTRIEAPFWAMRLSKYNICRLGQDLKVDLGKQTYSCQFVPACGKCDNCIIRRKAFGILNIKDEASYAS